MGLRRCRGCGRCGVPSRVLELFQEFLHCGDLCGLIVDHLLGEVEDVRALRVVKGSLRHVDGTFVVHDHLFEEQTAGLGGVCVLQQGHVFFGHHAVVTAH